mgnify:CR=1 FL=1
MSNLTPPTDNLYKFIAIAGLSLIIVGTLSLTAVLTGPDKLIESAITSAKQYVAFVDKQNITKKELTADETSRLFALEAEIKAYIEILDYRTMNARIVFLVLIVLVIVGMFVSATGFWLWYYKLQKPLDIELSQKGSKNQECPTLNGAAKP